MPTPPQIQTALDRVRDQATLLEFLHESLEWPNLEAAPPLQELGYAWTKDDLRTQDLPGVPEGKIWQLRLHDQQSWGIFVVEFASDKVYRTALRKVLRGLVPSRQRSEKLPVWQHENLLFICVTKDYANFTFAHFRGVKAAQATLATFGWDRGDPHLRTVCEHNLPPLTWPEENDFSPWAKAFDVEAVTSRFFADYTSVFKNVEEKVKGVKPADRRMYVQRLFNRLMFLYLIQRKGWLKFNGKTNYLRELFNAAEAAKESFLNERLYWTFFYGLNTLGEDAKLAKNIDLDERRGRCRF